MSSSEGLSVIRARRAMIQNDSFLSSTCNGRSFSKSLSIMLNYAKINLVLGLKAVSCLINFTKSRTASSQWGPLMYASSCFPYLYMARTPPKHWILKTTFILRLRLSPTSSRSSCCSRSSSWVRSRLGAFPMSSSSYIKR